MHVAASVPIGEDTIGGETGQHVYGERMQVKSGTGRRQIGMVGGSPVAY